MKTLSAVLIVAAMAICQAGWARPTSLAFNELLKSGATSVPMDERIMFPDNNEMSCSIIYRSVETLSAFERRFSLFVNGFIVSSGWANKHKRYLQESLWTATRHGYSREVNVDFNFTILSLPRTYLTNIKGIQTMRFVPKSNMVIIEESVDPKSIDTDTIRDAFLRENYPKSLIYPENHVTQFEVCRIN